MGFFLRLDVKPLNWEDRLALFVGYLIQSGKQSSTIRSYISAIRAVLKIEGIDINDDVYLLGALTRACKLKNDRIRVRLPLKRSLLNVLIGKLDDLFPKQPYLVKLYRALFIITHSGLFQIGEVTESPHVVKAKNVLIGTNKKKLKFILWTSKTHGLGDKPQIIKIESTDSDPLLKKSEHSGDDNGLKWCPFSIMREYLAVRQPGLQIQTQSNFLFSVMVHL